MMVKFTERSNTRKMLMIFKLMVKLRRMLLIPDFHTHQL
jgi:hypothetical protein